MKTLILAAIRCSLMFTAVAVTSLCFVQPAQAYSLTMKEVGNNVVANGSGAINLTGLSGGQTSQGIGLAVIAADGPIIQTGPTSLLFFDVYNGSFAGPTNFGSCGCRTCPCIGVPDAGSTLPLLGFASLALAALRRKLSC
jgi:VPDSG-CTERM motif